MPTNVELIKSAVEAMNSRQLDRLVELFAPDMVRHDLAGAYPDVTGEQLSDLLGELSRGIPDLHINLLDVFGDGDRVASRIVFEGTHQGPLFGREGTGRRIAVNQLNIYRVADGKLAESWQLPDMAGFLSQIGG
ncbi:MAG: ester cyclase [Dehalococcoidia bacterium]|nr:ester cyclase [Dehalococcoidia bacterium]